MDSTIPIAVPLDSAPSVTVIVPARNEEANLERCLRSLAVQQGVTFEIVVVNDGSTDGTLEIARNFTRERHCAYLGVNPYLTEVTVLAARQPLPEGWTGKTNAMVTAESAAHGEWLLFTDADTEHMPGSLAAAVAEAEYHSADLLSYSPEQLLNGIRQRLLMPLIFGELAVTYSPNRINQPECPDAAANGQYMLVRATSHQAVGGFSSVARELLEDVALARLYKQHKYKIRFRLGRGRVRTRMYRSWPELLEGWTKNLALLFPRSRPLAGERMFEFSILMLLPAISAAWTAEIPIMGMDALRTAGAQYWLMAAAGILLWLLSLSRYALFYARVSRAHFPFWPTLLSVFGLPWFAALLRRSARAHEQGSVTWRGRGYATATSAGAAGPPTASNTEKS